MTNILLMLKTHQPIRIAEYSFFDLGKHKNYFNENLNKHIIGRIADACYLPVNRLLQKVIKRAAADFKFSISISGATIDQLEKHQPETLQSFVDLVGSGNIEVLCEPYYYSLAFNSSPAEFEEQVMKHKKKIESLFGQQPVTFLNTEFCYNNDIAKSVRQMGFWGMLTEGADRALEGRSPNQVFNATAPGLNLFFRNYRLSDDVKFRYSDYAWKNYPLTPQKYYSWIKNSGGDITNLFYDYENFGEHHKKETGIFDFFEKTLTNLLKSKKIEFKRFQDVIAKNPQLQVANIPSTVSRADQEKDLSAWKSNAMQYESLSRIYDLEDKVKSSADPELLHQWRLLQTADHFYYMSTKGMRDGQVHKNFSPFNLPHDAYRYYMNILSDFELKIDKVLGLRSAPLTGVS